MFFKPQFYRKGKKVSISKYCEIVNAEGYPKEVLESLIEKYGEEKGAVKKISVFSALPDFYNLEKREEGYAVEIKNKEISLYGEDNRTKIYAAVTLLQMADSGELCKGFLCDAPDSCFRGYRVFLPSRKGLADFKDMVRFLANYKYNYLSLEVGGAMEYKRHPKINEEWKKFAAETHKYSGRTHEIEFGYPWVKNSIHTDNADGEILTQDEVREIIEFCNYHGLEVYPEVPTLCHSDYICMAYPEIAERQEDPYPDTYCPNHPDTYKIVFDVLEEVIEVFNPKIVNIGHDECYTLCVCDKCKEKEPFEIFTEDVIKIHSWLKERGIRTSMWADKLLPMIKDGHGRGGSGGKYITPLGNKVYLPTTFYCQSLLPKDILMFHWSYAYGIQHDYVLHSNGYETVFANMSASSVVDWRHRRNLGIKGGTCSNWGSFAPLYMQRNSQYFNLIFGAYALWSPDYDNDIFADVTLATYEECFRLKYGNLEKKPHITVTHTTDFEVPFTVFVDGIFIEYDKYHMGKYKLSYKDGTEELFDVNYGENISNCNIKYSLDADDTFDEFLLSDTPIKEVSCSTIPEKIDGKTYYKTVFINPHPEKEIKSFEYIPEKDAKVEIFEVIY